MNLRLTTSILLPAVFMLLLVSCGGGTAPEVVVKEVPVEVIKEVIVEKIVEVVVTATPMPTATPTPVVTFPDSNLNAAIRKTDLPPWTIPV